MSQSTCFDEMYELTTTVLGRGTFGVVVEAIRRADGQKVAVKIISSGKANDDESLLEGNTIKLLGPHKNVVQCIESFTDYATQYIVMELLSGPTLKELIHRHGGSLDEYSAAHVVRGILSGLSHIHAKGLVHRDLKLDNIIMSQETLESNVSTRSINTDGTPVIIDFGSAALETDCRTTCGTIRYMAPEVLLAALNDSGYTRQCDLWSLGVVAHVLLTGRFPFEGKSSFAISREITNHQALDVSDVSLWGKTSLTARSFVTALLDPSPDRRLSAKEALCHPWLNPAARLG